MGFGSIFYDFRFRPIAGSDERLLCRSSKMASNTLISTGITRFYVALRTSAIILCGGKDAGCHRPQPPPAFHNSSAIKPEFHFRSMTELP
jgi:hypothetical protein